MSVPPANHGRVLEPSGTASWDSVEVAALLDGTVPDTTLTVVAGDRAPVAADQLAACHDGDDGLVVVGEAPADLATGQRGALAGVGGTWVATSAAVRAALALAPTSEAELRWLLWNDGARVVAAPGATTAPAPVAQLAADPWVVDRVPLPGVRSLDVLEATVPTVSVVVHGPSPDPAVLAPWPHTSRVPSEVLVVSDDEPGPAGHLRRVPDLDAAVELARGAVLLLVDGRARADREAFARALRRLSDERIEWVQLAYELPAGTSRGTAALLVADAGLDAPGFALVRRRALRKHRRPGVQAWPEVVATERGTVVVSHPVKLPVEAPVSAVPGVRALLAAPIATARELVADVRDRGTAAPSAPSVPATRPSVGWVGFSGNQNFGDELVLLAAHALLEGVEIVPGRAGSHGTVLGGGTLLNADRYYRRIADDLDLPGHARLVLGTGVVSPDVRGWTEELASWRAFLADGHVGVRGPHSLAHLRAWGWDGPAEVVGDPALAIVPSAEREQGLVVLAPVAPSSVGQIAPDDERAQLELLLGAARAWRSQGRRVAVLSAHPADDRVAVSLLQGLGTGDLEVVAGYRDLDAGLDLVARADLVVGTRLHALVAAAAAGTPFLGMAYRPKLADFAASVGAEAAVRAVGAWTLDTLVAAAEETEQRRLVVAEHVARLRERLREHAAAYVEAVTSAAAARGR